MNQKQREFLIDRIQRTCRQQEDTLKEGHRPRPSLNNYMVAAFMDGSVQFNDLDVLKEKMRQRVLRSGTEDAIISSGSRHYSRRNDDEKNFCEIEAEELFVMPPAYLEALAEYEREQQAIDDKISLLHAQRDTIVMKVQLGSDKVLDKGITYLTPVAEGITENH